MKKLYVEVCEIRRVRYEVDVPDNFDTDDNQPVAAAADEALIDLIYIKETAREVDSYPVLSLFEIERVEFVTGSSPNSMWWGY